MQTSKHIHKCVQIYKYTQLTMKLFINTVYGANTALVAICIQCKAFATVAQLMTAVCGTRAVWKVSVCIVSGGDLKNRLAEKRRQMT